MSRQEKPKSGGQFVEDVPVLDAFWWLSTRCSASPLIAICGVPANLVG